MAIVNSSSQTAISNGFLRMATEIVQNNQSSEEALRTAINRAYYSVFLTVRDHMFGADGNGLTRAIRNRLGRRFQHRHRWYPGSHDLILFALADLTASSTIHPITLSQQIGQLKLARIRADYNFAISNLQDIPYDTWLVYANHMVALASQLLPDARRLPSYTSP